MTSRRSVQQWQSGFTLVEMAMVLLIVALLLGGLLPTISGQVEQRKINEARKQLDEIQQALIGYAITNGRLPCPATPGTTGTENPINGGNCANSYNGLVPASTLGLAGTDSAGYINDPWGNPVHYAVASWASTLPTSVLTTAQNMSKIGLTTLNDNSSFKYLLVCPNKTGINTATPSCGAGSTSLTSAPGVPVVLFSAGKNGTQAGISQDEAQNLAGTKIFISHDPTQDGYDDIITWISINTLLNRMVAAGKLP